MAYSIFKGADAALRDIQKLQAFSPDEFARALYQEAQVELKEIKRITPVDTGALRASIGITEPIRSGRRIYVEVYAGGPTAPYAWTVHYDLEAFHENGEAMFIENPLMASAPHMAERIARRIDLNKAL